MENKLPKTITTEEETTLLREIQVPTQGHRQPYKCHRNYLITLLMLDAGLRVGEVTGLSFGDLVFNQEPVRSVVINRKIAKNNHERTVPLTERLQKAIEAMIPLWSVFKHVPDTNPAIRSHPGGPRITVRQVERIMRTISARILGRNINPHQLRHTFATRLMRVTSVRTVQQLLGHLSLSSTQIYTHPTEKDRTDAIKRLNSVDKS